SSWVQRSYIKTSNPDTGDALGFQVAVAGDVLIASAPNEASAATAFRTAEPSMSSCRVPGAGRKQVTSKHPWRMRTPQRSAGRHSERYLHNRPGWHVAGLRPEPSRLGPDWAVIGPWPRRWGTIADSHPRFLRRGKKGRVRPSSAPREEGEGAPVSTQSRN